MVTAETGVHIPHPSSPCKSMKKISCIFCDYQRLFEPRREKTSFLHMRKQRCRCGNRKADQHLCFRYIDSTIPLLPKYRLYSLVCVRPGRKPRRPVFSQRGSFCLFLHESISCGYRQSMVAKQKILTFFQQKITAYL